jgi:hypothetical protein
LARHARWEKSIAEPRERRGRGSWRDTCGNRAGRRLGARQYAGNPEGGSGDVVCENFPFHIEGKRCQALKPEEWMAQAKRDCPAGKIPAVFFRRNGRKEWLVVLSADDVCELARQLAPAREIKIDYMPSTHVKGFYVTSPHDLDQLTPTTTNKINQ